MPKNTRLEESLVKHLTERMPNSIFASVSFRLCQLEWPLGSVGLFLLRLWFSVTAAFWATKSASEIDERFDFIDTSAYDRCVRAALERCA